MNIGHVQRTFTAEPVVDPVPGTDPSHPLETVPASGPDVPGPARTGPEGHDERRAEPVDAAAEETVG